MDFIYAFLVGGVICLIGQLLLDFVKLTPAHLMATFVVIGAILDGFGLYDKLIKFAGAGATVPITSFGHSLLHGAMHARKTWIFRNWYWHVCLTSAGISATILFSFL